MADIVHTQLTIYSKEDEKKSYTVLVNPSSYQVSHKACYINDQVPKGNATTVLNKLQKQTFKLDLLFDSTGSLGILTTLLNKSVLEQIDAFMDVAFVDKVKQSEGKLVELIWGKMHFECVLTNVDFTYTHFNALGDPIRATAVCNFTGDEVSFNDIVTVGPFDNLDIPNIALKLANVKHPINSVMQYGSYLSVLAEQPKTSLPKSLRIKEEVEKLIIKS